MAIFFLGISLLLESGLPFMLSVTEVELIRDNAINIAGVLCKKINRKYMHKEIIQTMQG